ncbi:MAG: FecR domain-containing protein [Saprospiraceae bacterium]
MEDKDLHNNVLEFLEDPSFVRWVKSGGTANSSIWENYLRDNPDQHPIIEEAKSILLGLVRPNDAKFDKDAIWDRIKESTIEVQIEQKMKPAGRIFNIRYLWAGVAAAVSIGFIFLKTFQGSEYIQTTHASEQASVVLPDNSEILMDAGSEVSFDKRSWEQHREVHLKGLAYFEVQKGKTFEVITNQGIVTVLGTSFSVYARDDRMEVYCKTGKVSVKSNQNVGESQILLPNEKVIFQAGVKTFLPMDTLNSTAWIQGTYTFSNQQLSLVFDELERQFDIEIIVTDDIKSLHYTGFFHKKDVDAALKSVTWPLGLQYSIQGKIVTIYK